MSEQTLNIRTRNGEPEHDARFRAFKDALRRSFTGRRVVMTAGVAALPDRVQAAVQGFDAFSAANDPYREHAFASLTIKVRIRRRPPCGMTGLRPTL